MNRLLEIHTKPSLRGRGHLCALCDTQVEARHLCYGCNQYVCDNCAGAANEKPLTEAHALKAHVEKATR
jgi:hypothetical protein